MPAIAIWNQEWLNQNSQRSYPLSEEATKRDESDSIEIPDSFIVGLRFPVHAGMVVETDKFFLRLLGIYPTGYVVAIAYDDESSDPPLVASINIAKATHATNRVYSLPGVDDFADSSGQICIGNLDSIDLLPPGQYLFTADGGRLDSDVILPMIRGISSIVAVNGSDRTAKLTGDIELVAGNNYRLGVIQVEGQNPRIVFNAIEGEGLIENCACEDVSPGPPIRTINLQRPKPNGDFTLLGNDCMNITPITNGLSLSDVCSQPCCGCEELEALKGIARQFGDNATTLQNFANRLSGEVSQMNTIVLGSRLGDAGCTEC